MDPYRVEITKEQFIDAVEKNGYRQAYGEFFKQTPNRILFLKIPSFVIAACAAGQAFMNLGIDPGDYRGLSISGDDDYPMKCPECGTNLYGGVVSTTIHLNDSHHLPIPKIAQHLRSLYSGN